MKFPVAVLLLAGASAYGSTLTVNNNNANTSSPCKSAAYTTISAAITAAAAGDTVQVCPGVYPEALHINKTGLKLNGLTVNGSSLVEVMPSAGIATTDLYDNSNTNVVVLVDAVTGVAISNISVNGSQATAVSGCSPGNEGIYFRNASGSITNSAVSNIGLNPDGSLTGCQEGIGIYVDTAGGTASLTVTGTSVHDYDKSGIVADGVGTTLVATGNTVTGYGPTNVTAQNGIEVDDGAKGTVNSNIVVGDDYLPSAWSASGILFYAAGSGVTANSNTISETNGGIYFYKNSNATANSNNISKTINYDAIAAQNSNNDTIEKNTITRSGFEVANQSAIWVCGSKNKIESNNINETPVGVYDDRTTADGCNGSSGNTTTLNLYHNVGIDTMIYTDQVQKAASMSVIKPAKPSPAHRVR